MTEKKYQMLKRMVKNKSPDFKIGQTKEVCALFTMRPQAVSISGQSRVGSYERQPGLGAHT